MGNAGEGQQPSFSWARSTEARVVANGTEAPIRATTTATFAATGTGKVIRVKAWRGHHLEIKSSRRTRRYAGKALMRGVHAEQVRRLLPYL